MASSSYLLIDPAGATSLSSHPDNYIINNRSGYGIDEIRKFNSWVQRKPFSRQYKLALIIHAEHVSVEGQNALLKTLEEPPQQTFIFLSTKNKELLLPTILSRCQMITLTELTQGKIPHHPDQESWEKNIIEQEVSHDPIEQFPVLQSMTDVFEQAKKYSSTDRIQLQQVFEEWGKQTLENPNTANYQLAEFIIQAKEHLTHNTNVQHTLEVLFMQAFNISTSKNEAV
ncbi:hypothetical protein HGA91_04360 [candidate division WWE3 bacterium]|nr:hypothetical protein [candidate division WWE3 bacterium]